MDLRILKPAWPPEVPAHEITQRVDELRDELAKIEIRLEMMNAANRAIRMYWHDGDEPKRQGLIDAGFSPKQAADILDMQLKGLKPGFRKYQIIRLQNEANEIRRKIGKFLGTPVNEVYWFAGVRVVNNVYASKVQIFFHGTPNEKLVTLFRQYGFRYSEKYGAWQRKIGPTSLKWAAMIVKRMG